MSRHPIRLTVNNKTYEATVSARMTLVDFLRDVAGLTGTHVGCEHGVCGACSVLFDGQPIRSCLMFAVQADGASRSEEHTSELQSLMRISYAVFCLKKKKIHYHTATNE